MVSSQYRGDQWFLFYINLKKILLLLFPQFCDVAEVAIICKMIQPDLAKYILNLKVEPKKRKRKTRILLVFLATPPVVVWSVQWPQISTVGIGYDFFQVLSRWAIVEMTNGNWTSVDLSAVPKLLLFFIVGLSTSSSFFSFLI